MPQMAPMNWTIMYCLFISIFILTMILIFFYYNNKKTSFNNQTSISTNNMNLINWKW